MRDDTGIDFIVFHVICIHDHLQQLEITDADFCLALLNRYLQAKSYITRSCSHRCAKRLLHQQSAMMKTDAGTCVSLSVSLLTTSSRQIPDYKSRSHQRSGAGGDLDKTSSSPFAKL